MASQTLSYTYYPGCSLEGLSREYDISLKVVGKTMGLQLEELEDWNCCGASTLVSVDRLFSVLAPARTLALASEHPRDVVVACNSCYLVLRKTLELYRTDKDLRGKVDAGLKLINRKLNPDLRVRHLLEVIYNDVGLDAVKALVNRPLAGFRLAPYYGCQIARPYGPTEPTQLEELLGVLGAENVSWDSKTRCCGSSLLASLKLEGLELVRHILDDATTQNVDGIAVMCPLCQVNLDAYQAQVNTRFKTSYQLPIVYFTQLMGVAFGISPSRLGFHRLITSASGLLKKHQAAQEVTVP